MQQLILYTVVYSFDRNKRLRKDGTAGVLIRAYQSGSYAYFNTGVFVEPSQWCRRTNRVKNHPRQQVFNATILNLQRKLEQYEATSIQMGQGCSLKQLKGYGQQPTSNSFIDFFKEEMAKERHNVKASTYETYGQTLAKMEAYKPGWTFQQLRPGVIRDFLNFLSAQGLHTNSVHKHYKTFKKFVRIAQQHGRLQDARNPCEPVKCKLEKTTPLYLTEDEVLAFEAYQVPADKPLWHLAQQLFLFCCYTGLRYSDVSELTDDNFVEKPKGLEMHFTAQKTGKPYRLDIGKLFAQKDQAYSKPEAIIRARLDSDDYWPGGRVFPFSHRNTYVRNLKQIAANLPIRKVAQRDISSHTGRHTFGTLLARQVDVEVLQQLMQHSLIRETMLYVHLTEKRVYEALDNVKW